MPAKALHVCGPSTLAVAESQSVQPLPNELLIHPRAAALNPCDAYMYSTGMLIDAYPVVLGCDVAGTVLAVGSNLTSKYQKGDRVVAQSDSTKLRVTERGEYEGMTFSSIFAVVKDAEGREAKKMDKGWSQGRTVSCYGGFQDEVLIMAPSVCKIPDFVKYEEAAVLPLALNTAASCIFGQSCLGLDMPGASKMVEKKNKMLLIWGASASVGVTGVQLAALAGYDVVGIASTHNHGLVKEAGASKVFDYNDKDVVEQIVTYCKDKDVVGAYAAIATDATTDPLIEILGKIPKARKFIASVMPGDEKKARDGVEIKSNLAEYAGMHGLGKKIWEWLETALAEGRMKALPRPEVVGEGWENVEKGLKRLGGGVSGTKLVVKV